MAVENGETGNPLDQGSDPHSVEHAAADFSAMLNDEGRPPRKEREKPASRAPEKSDDAAQSDDRQPTRERPEPSADEPEDRRHVDPILDNPQGTEDKGEDEDDEDPDDSDQDRDDDPDDDDDDDADPEAELLGTKIKIKVNGEEREVTVQEARDGYMRQQDYSQASERNAREYEEIETFATETVQHRQSAITAQDQALAIMEALQPTEADWNALKAGDPAKFIAAQEHWQGIQNKAREILEARKNLGTDEGASNDKRTAKYFETQERKLVEKIPALRDDKKADAFRATVMEYGLKAGYSEAELREGAVDHRDLITLYKAAQYDKSRASISAAGRRAGKNNPKPSTEGRARAPGNRPANKTGRNADRRLARTGSVQDAAESFAEMIRGESR